MTSQVTWYGCEVREVTLIFRVDNMEVYAIYMMVRYRFDIENIYTGKHRIAIYMVIRYRFDIENIYIRRNIGLLSTWWLDIDLI